jgi:SAM-dependent methyltransferase
MPSETASADLRGLNARIAQSYDHVPYDAAAIAAIDPERVFGLAALYGEVAPGPDIDVLDLGCGAGAQLERLAGLTTGRVIGTDLSQSGCARAAERTARFGERCRVIRADFLDLDADALGRFDLIYHVGVLYVTPPEVQQRILALIAACLKPGGVAVISHYFGASTLIMAGLRDVIGGAVDRSAAPAAQTRSARACMQGVGDNIARMGSDQRGLLGLLQQILARDDATFYHEMLSPSFAAISTSSLEAVLGAKGVHFLNRLMPPGPFGFAPAPRERALLADSFDLTGGGYHYAAFRKHDSSRPPALRADHVLWHSRLRRVPGADGKAAFKDPQFGASAAPHPATAAALDILARGPCDWRTLSARGDAPAILEQEFVMLWQHGLVAPLFPMKGETP